MKPSEIISKALDVLGPNGERWGQHYYYNEGKFCMLGSLRTAATGELPSSSAYHYKAANPQVFETIQESKNLVREALRKREKDDHVPTFNDHSQRTFTEVKAVMCDALKLALKKKEHANGTSDS